MPHRPALRLPNQDTFVAAAQTANDLDAGFRDPELPGQVLLKAVAGGIVYRWSTKTDLEAAIGKTPDLIPAGARLHPHLQE